MYNKLKFVSIVYDLDLLQSFGFAFCGSWGDLQ